jgi:hypothetical protein
LTFVAAFWLAPIVLGCESTTDDTRVVEDASPNGDSNASMRADAANVPLPDAASRGFSAVRQGDEVLLTGPEGVKYDAACGPPKLVIRRDPSWLFLEDQRPPRSSHAGYYIDDTFVSPVCNLGCDGGSPLGFLTTHVLPVVEYIDVGFRAAPPGYELPPVFPCRPLPAGDAGADAGPPDLPLLERRVPTGELAVRLTYWASGERTTSVVIVPVETP